MGRRRRTANGRSGVGLIQSGARFSATYGNSGLRWPMSVRFRAESEDFAAEIAVISDFPPRSTATTHACALFRESLPGAPRCGPQQYLAHRVNCITSTPQENVRHPLRQCSVQADGGCRCASYPSHLPASSRLACFVRWPLYPSSVPVARQEISHQQRHIAGPHESGGGARLRYLEQREPLNLRTSTWTPPNSPARSLMRLTSESKCLAEGNNLDGG